MKRRLGFLLFISLLVSPAFAGKAAGTEDVFQVLFPTDTAQVFDFIMDPQELIAQTNAAAYGDLTFEEGATLFFRRHEEGAGVDYSSASDSLVITNMGSVDVELVVKADISPDSLGGIVMTSDKTFADDMGASLYLALTDGERIVPIDSGEGALIHTTLAGIDEGDETGREYRFWLVGAVNRDGDWSEIGEANPKITVTWSAAPGQREEAEEEPVMETEDGLPENGENLQESSEAEEASEKAEVPESEEPSEETEMPGQEDRLNETETSGTETVPKEAERMLEETTKMEESIKETEESEPENSLL